MMIIQNVPPITKMLITMKFVLQGLLVVVWSELHAICTLISSHVLLTIQEQFVSGMGQDVTKKHV